MKKSLTLAAIVGSALLFGQQKVGINTESPSAKLHVNGDMRISNTTGTPVGPLLRWDPISHKVVGSDETSKEIEAGVATSPQGEYFPQNRPQYPPFVTDIDANKYNLIVSSTRLASVQPSGFVGLDLVNINNFAWNTPVSYIQSFVKDGKWAFALDYVASDPHVSGGGNVNWKLGILAIDKNYSDTRTIEITRPEGYSVYKISLPSNPMTN